MTKYLDDEKTHKAINNHFFKRLNDLAKDLFEMKLSKFCAAVEKLNIVAIVKVRTIIQLVFEYLG